MMARLLSPSQTALAARIVTNGGIVAVPTDTVYGLACDPFNARAVERLFEVKGREGKPVSVLCADQRTAETLVEFSNRARDLAARYWPGPLTIVCTLRGDTQGRIPPLLHQNSGWLGVRVPDCATTLSLAEESGGAITGTSANLSGKPSCRTAEEVVSSLGGGIDAIIDGGRLAGVESTVVKVAGETIEVLRRGSLDVEQGRTSRERHQTK